MNDLKEKLKTEVETADWDMLRIHHERQAVFLVDQSIELLDVAVAVAQDNSQLVSMWLTDKKLARPEEELVSEFEKDDYKKIFDFVIIQPYVLVQLKKSETLH